jgi:TDG/mug DNA glycosylase family protein
VDTLPDYLSPGLDIVFVGINPGAYSAEVGRYFATPQNRFWPALSRSGLVPANRELGPPDDVHMHEFGIGFTDVVKRPSRSASDLRAADYREGAPVLREKLLRYQPLVVCFNGLTGYRGYLRYSGDRCPEGRSAKGVALAPKLGPQEHRIGESGVFVVPSPSPANAAYSLKTLVGWYARLAVYRDKLNESHR